jgi:hypothetical protein
MVFYEKFTTQIGSITFECFRSPRKKARILELVRDNPNFMQGATLSDEKDNPIRILEFISGKTLADMITVIQTDHEAYFYETMPMPVVAKGAPSFVATPSASSAKSIMAS